jgi:hypothetical protein
MDLSALRSGKARVRRELYLSTAGGVLYQQDSFLCLNHAPCRLFPVCPQDFLPVQVFAARHPVYRCGNFVSDALARFRLQNQNDVSVCRDSISIV